MTTPTNSDRLREGERQRLYLQIDDHLTQIDAWSARALKAEAEINKLYAEKAETIEVLEGFPVEPWEAAPMFTTPTGQWLFRKALPLLDKLRGES